MKLINKLSKKIKKISEAFSNLDLEDPEIQKKLGARKNEILRLAEVAKNGAAAAEKAGKTADAEKLRKLQAQLEAIAATGKFETVDKPISDTIGASTNSDGVSVQQTNSDMVEVDNPESDEEEEEDSESEEDDTEDTEEDDSDADSETDSEDDSEEDDTDSNDKDDLDFDDDAESDDNDSESDTESDNEDTSEEDDDESSAKGTKDDSEEEDEDEDEDGGNGESESEEDETGDDGTDSDEEAGEKSGTGGADSESDEEDDSEEEEEEEEDSDFEFNDSPEQSKKQNNKSQKDTSEEDDDDNGADDKDTYLDPFSSSLTGRTVSTAQVDKDKLVDGAIKRLNTLRGKSKDGARDALKNLLKRRFGLTDAELNNLAAESANNETLNINYIGSLLTEDLRKYQNKSLDELTDDEFADLTKETLDEINKLYKVPIEADDPDRLKNIQIALNSQTFKRQLDTEDSLEIAKDFQKTKALDKSAVRYSNFPSLANFKVSLFNVIRDQITVWEDTEQTYSRFNTKDEDPLVVRKGEQVEDKFKKDKPSIDFYFDMSGSYAGDDNAIKVGKQLVATLYQFVKRKELDLNVFYFSDTVESDINSPNLGRGTTAWLNILSNIKSTGAKNVVILTDADMVGQAGTGPTLSVKGHVWYIWNMYGIRSNWEHDGLVNLPNHLYGKKGTTQYAFNSADMS